MLPKDKFLISKLRRTIALLSFITLFLSYWILDNYYLIDFYKSENTIYTLELKNKNDEISKLKKKLNSNYRTDIIKPNISPTKKIKKTKIEEPKQIIDTTIKPVSPIENVVIDAISTDTIK